MDIEALISSVFVRPAIWDKREKMHSNRIIVDTCWKEIAKELRVDEISLRKKWKYLRDQFVVEFAKIHPSHSGDAGDSSYEPKWPYFKSISFLKDVVKPRATSSNLSTAAVEESAPPKEDSLTPIKRTSKSLCKKMKKESLPLCSPPPKARNRHSGTDRYNEAILDIERKKLKYLQSKAEKQQNDDEDLLFFKSLLPHMKVIEPAKKLLFRSRILEIVSQFAYPTSSPFPYSSHSSFPFVSSNFNTNSPRSCSSNTTQSPQISSPRPSPPPSNYPHHFPSTSPDLSQPALSPDSNPGVLQSCFPNPHT